ncbi:MAG: amidohydrolase family protein [Blastocatellia bacterium]
MQNDLEMDLILRGGLVVDGTGAEPFVADVAVTNGRIGAVGKIAARGRRELDAGGLLVTPGFVDIHTHYDGQVTWENRLVPSSSHGVTTVVMGNCGVGFAPCRRDQHELLIHLMEGVEDIPHPVLVEGLPWTWESYPEYLDFLAGRSYDMDVCGYLPHAAIRVFVMGQRGADREAATDADLAQMATLVREAMQAGAMGVSTSLTFLHRSSDGRPTPSFEVAERELLTLAEALRESGRGIFQMVTDLDDPVAAFARLRRVAEAAGRPLTFTLLEGQHGPLTLEWRQMLDWVAEANAASFSITPQVLGRAIGVLLGHELTLNPFYTTTTYCLLAALPFDERIAQLRQPEIRAQILAEAADPNPQIVLGRLVQDFAHMYILGDPPDYEQPPTQSIAALAQAASVTPQEFVYDHLLQRDGRDTLYVTLSNYVYDSLDSTREMMLHPHTVVGLGDGGAHCGTICDGSLPTFMLTHWVRDRQRGARLPLPWVVKSLSHDPAQTVGLLDRGLIAPGYKADLNLIDLDRLHLHAPEVTYDLPSGGRRLVQRAEGFAATIVSGEIVYQHGAATGRCRGGWCVGRKHKFSKCGRLTSSAHAKRLGAHAARVLKRKEEIRSEKSYHLSVIAREPRALPGASRAEFLFAKSIACATAHALATIPPTMERSFLHNTMTSLSLSLT